MSPAEPPLLAPGTRLNGVFEIDRHVAAGRAGEIYHAHAVETGAPAAIKTMRAGLTGSTLALALFRREASALHDVNHEAIVRCYLFSHDPGTGRHYLAMEYVDGPSLSALIQEGPLCPGTVHVLHGRLAAGLHAAHQHGVIHCNLSPDSVLVPARDLSRAKIIGFGAIPVGVSDGAAVGSATPNNIAYAAPEQFGLFGGEVTARSDIYGLGLVLAACLIGRPLDMGRSALDMLQKRRAVPDLREIDRRFRPLLERMLQPDPADRPESMTAVASWRPRPETGAAPRDAARGPALPAWMKAAARRPLTGIAAALALLLGVGSAGFYFASDRGRGRLPDLLSDLASPWLAAPSDSNTAAAKHEDEVTAAVRRNGLAAGSRQRVIEFVNAYDGGDCFFISPEEVEDSRATLYGLGASVAPFEVLDYEFKRKNGYEPSIGVHQVVAEQCPAVSFLFRTRRQQSTAPRLDAVTAGLKEGGPLTGSISSAGAAAIELLLVADDGYVRNLTALLRQGGAGPAFRTFTIGIRKTSPGPPRPQLLMAVASAKPLDALRLPPDGTLAAQVFPKALAEAAGSGQTLAVTAKYFMLER
jgi:serine/threonine-protein kinase